MHQTTRRSTIVAILVLATAFVIYAQEDSPGAAGPTSRPTVPSIAQPIRTNRALERPGVRVEPAPKIWGADATVYVPMGRAPTGPVTWAALGAGARWGGESYYRGSDGSPLDSASGSSSVDYNRLRLDWRVGLLQGLTYNQRTSRNGFELGLLFRGRYDYAYNDEATAQTVFDHSPDDVPAILRTSALLAVRYDDVQRSDWTYLRDGYEIEVSGEWGPGVLLNTLVGGTDFYRLNATAQGFVPVLRDASRPDGGVRGYAAFFSAIDYAGGAFVPRSVRSSFGGLSPRDGLGGAVRGLETQRLDGNLKFVANVELRTFFPALWPGVLTPALIAYVDVGHAALFADAPEGTAGRWVASSGVGLGLNILDLTTIIAYTHILINDTLVDGGRWTPFAVGFSLHF